MTTMKNSVTCQFAKRSRIQNGMYSSSRPMPSHCRNFPIPSTVSEITPTSAGGMEGAAVIRATNRKAGRHIMNCSSRFAPRGGPNSIISQQSAATITKASSSVTIPCWYEKAPPRRKNGSRTSSRNPPR